MQHAADSGGIFFAQDCHDPLVGVAVMDNDRQRELYRQADEPPENLFLINPRRAVTIEVEADFANGDNLAAPGASSSIAA